MSRHGISTTTTEVKSFLGICSYYRLFVPSFADAGHPLHQCALAPYQWTAEAEDTFQKLKASLTDPPVLAYPELDGVLKLDTDVSSYGVGAVLSQRLPPGNWEQVVAYYSKALTTAKRRYCVT